MSVPDFHEYFRGEAREHLMSLLVLALAEDGVDLTSNGIFSAKDRLNAVIIAKERTLVAGLPVIPLVMDMCASSLGQLSYNWQSFVKEGDEVPAGVTVARILGPARQVLKAERVILNMVCHLSGIANLTKTYVDALQGTSVRLLDTRKTLPGLRYPDKYAVRLGGGQNHRCNLSDMLMIKDNHIDAAGSITAAVDALRAACDPCPPIEVECRNQAEISEAVACRVDRIMLDNMGVDALPAALALIPHTIETEVSGGVTLDSIRSLATPGLRQPDFISVGRITHSAPAADFSMRLGKEQA